MVGVALREYVFLGVAGPPFLQLSSILPMDCIQIFALCVAASWFHVRVKFPRDTDTQACPRRDLWRATISAT